MKIAGSFPIVQQKIDYLKNTGTHIVTETFYTITRHGIIIPTIRFYPTINNVDTFYFDNFEDTVEYIDSSFDNISISKGDTVKFIHKDGNVCCQLFYKDDEYERHKAAMIYHGQDYCINLLPELCPSCGKDLSYEDHTYHTVPKCINIACPSLLYYNVNLFLNKLGFTTDNCIRMTINKLISREIIKDPFDIFLVNQKTLEEVEGINKKIAEQMFNEILEFREGITFERLLYALFHDVINYDEIMRIARTYTNFMNLLSALFDSKYEEVNEFEEFSNDANYFLTQFFESSDPVSAERVNKIMMLQICC